MKKISWEIVLAGILFIVAAAFLINKDFGDKDEDVEVAVSGYANPDVDIDTDEQNTIIISLENLEKLESLENLENLENLEEHQDLQKLQKLEKLEKLKSLLPKEAAIEIEKGLAEALRELETELASENISIKISNENLIISSDYNTEEGAWSEVSPGKYIYKQKFDISSVDEAELDMAFGHITVIGTDASEGYLTLTASGKKIKSTSDIGKELKLATDVKSNKVYFGISREPKEGKSYNNNGIQLEAKLVIPNKVSLIAETDGGHVQIENITGEQTIQTDGGHITLANLSGVIDAVTDGGHITAKKINGEVKLVTDGGHIELKDGTGSATMITDGGHIIAKKYSGGLEATTSGGNIDLKLIDFTAPISAKTSAGNVSIYLPSGADADVKAYGTKVYMEKYFELSGTLKKDKIVGKFGKGGNSILAATGHGNVYLKKSE